MFNFMSDKRKLAWIFSTIILLIQIPIFNINVLFLILSSSALYSPKILYTFTEGSATFGNRNRGGGGGGVFYDTYLSKKMRLSVRVYVIT